MSGIILLADDSLTIQKVIELTFAETGFDVIAVSSGEELLQKLPECRPDIVICDVIMPGKDGYEVCQEIKSAPDSLHIPVILLTGTFEPFDKDRALAAGCSEIITKPFEARKLVDAVERLVREDAGAPVSKPRATNDGSMRPPNFEDRTAPRSTVHERQSMPPVPFHYEGQVIPPAPLPQDEVDEVDEDEIDERNFATSFIELPASEAGPEYSSESDESLDFTSTGFSEMESAGQRDREAREALPEHGLEYEFDAGPTVETPIPSADTGPVEPYQPPEALDFSAPNTRDEPESVDTAGDEFEFGVSPSPDAGLSDGPEITSQEQDWNEPPEAGNAAPSYWHEASPSASSEPESGASDASTLGPYSDTDPIAPEVVSAYIDTPPPEPEPMPEEHEFIDSTELLEEPKTLSYEDESSFEDESSMEEAAQSEPVFGETNYPAGTASYEAEPASYEAEIETEETPDVTLAAAPGVAVQASALSDEDIDRIARRVLELAAEKIEMIAWEVIPDMAEIVVRERIRELEAQVESVESNSDEAFQ